MNSYKDEGGGKCANRREPQLWSHAFLRTPLDKNPRQAQPSDQVMEFAF
jgi:hypothetical protein